MPRYMLTQPAYINDRLHAAGETVETDLRPGGHMEPHKGIDGNEDPEARAAKDAADKEGLYEPGDPEYLGEMIDTTVNGGIAKGKVRVSSAHPDSIGPAQSRPIGVKVDKSGQVRGVG